MRALLLIITPFIAIWFGSKWQAVSSRAEGVTVTFKDDTKETGVLSRSWSGDYVLYKADEISLHFRDFRMIELVSKPIDESSFLLRNWRLFLPLTVVLLLISFLSIWRPAKPPAAPAEATS